MEGSNGEKEVQSAQYTISDSTSSSDEDGPDVYVPTFTIPFDSVTLGETSATRSDDFDDKLVHQSSTLNENIQPENAISICNQLQLELQKDRITIQQVDKEDRVISSRTAKYKNRMLIDEDIETDTGLPHYRNMKPVNNASVSQGNVNNDGEIDIDIETCSHKEELTVLENTGSPVDFSGGSIVTEREVQNTNLAFCDNSVGKEVGLKHADQVLTEEKNRNKEQTVKSNMEGETSEEAATFERTVDTLHGNEMPYDTKVETNNLGNLYPDISSDGQYISDSPQSQPPFIRPRSSPYYPYRNYYARPSGAYPPYPYHILPVQPMYGGLYLPTGVQTSNQVSITAEVDSSIDNDYRTSKSEPLNRRNQLEEVEKKAYQSGYDEEVVPRGGHQLYPNLQPDAYESDPKTSSGGSKIVITFTGEISEDTLSYYFDNTRKSGGGDIESLDVSSETGIAVIEFKAKEAAKNVLKNNSVHRVSNVDLTIHVIETDNDLDNVIEQSMVFVKGLKPTTSEDCLRDCMEVRANSEPTQITYGTDRKCAIIMFEEKIDFMSLEVACGRKPLEGNKLSVFRVPVTSCVLVSNIASKMTRDTVRYYFENERKSGGDDDAEIMEYNGFSCVIRFPSPQVARRVCRRKHVMKDFQLNVSLYYVFLRSHLVVPDLPGPEFFCADLNILKFIKNSPKVKEEFECELSKLNGCIIWPEDLENDDVRIECELDLSISEDQMKATSWPSDINNFTEQFKSSLTTMKMTTIEACWKTVKKELRSVDISDPERVGVFLDKDSFAIVLVGDKGIVKELCQTVKIIISDSERKVLALDNSSSKIISFKIYKLQLLWLLKYFDKVKMTYPDVNAECNLEKKEVNLTGPVESMQAAELFLRESANSFVNESFKMSKYKKELLFKKVSREIWYNECKTKQIMATWNVERGHTTCQMYARTKKEADRAIICMEDLFLEDEFLVEDQYDTFITSMEWKELVNTLERRNEKCFTVHTDNRRIQMAAIKYIFHEIKSEIEREIEKFSKLYGKDTVTVHCDKGVHMFLIHVGQNNVQAIEMPLKKMDVKIRGSDKDFSFKITGNKTGVAIAKSKFENLINKIHSDKYKIESFGIREYFSSTCGKRETIDIGKRNSCIVLHESEYSKQKAKTGQKGTKSWSPEFKKKEFQHDADHKIYLMQTDITKLEVDAIVNAANNDLDHCGGLAKAVVDAAGRSVQEECNDFIKNKGPIVDGDAMCSEPGKLPCKMIIHAVGPVWKGGYDGEEPLLKAAVLQCLYLTEQYRYCTVAIPALSGGIFGYPLDKCTLTIVETIKEYFNKYGSSTTVNEVYLCDISIGTVQKFDSALKRIYNGDRDTGEGLPPLEYPEPDHKPSREQFLRYPHHTESSPSRHDKLPKDESRDKHRYHNRTREAGKNSHEHHYSPQPRETESEDHGFFKVVKGLLSERQVDVIVNSIDQNMDLNHGRLSKSILQAAGDIIQTELYQHIDTFKPCQTVAVTSGGKLPCSKIFHGVLMQFDGTTGNSVKILENFVILCMIKATELGLSTIAFPAVGTGVLSFPADLVAKIMFDKIQHFQDKCPHSTIKSVEFVIYPKDTAAVNAFEDRLKKVSSKTNTQTFPDSKAQAPVSTPSTDYRLRPTGKVQSTQLGYINVLIKCGDITKESADAIVNSISYSLDLSRGAVSKAILIAGGQDIQRELTQEGESSKEKGLIVTSGGRLGCKHIFHIFAQSSSAGWEGAVTKCLTEAEKRRLTTLSLPALGTGQKACSPGDVATAIFQSIKKFTSTKHLKHVTLVVFQKEMAAVFIKALKKIAGLHKDLGKPQDSTRPKAASRYSVREESNTDIVKFYLWSDSWANISAAKRDLDKLAEAQCCQKSVVGYPDVVNQLKSDEIFREAEKKFNVKIKNQKGGVSIEGPQPNVDKACDHIRIQLREKESQMLDYERAKDVANYVQWYYQSEHDKKFRPFKLEDNLKIETAYKNKNATVKIRDNRGVSYTIDFQKMVEIPSDSSHVKIPVKREIKEQQRGQGVPSTWSKVQMKDQQLCYEEELFPGNTEYDRVKMEFQRSGGSRSIVKIYRVQNPTLYLQYAAKKKELWKKNNKNPEKWLWHGTSADTVNNIINHGFNRSYCGKNGTALGAGVYFAVNAGYSVGYCQPGTGGCHIFSVQVLTGIPCQGNSGMKVLPTKSYGGMTYDSSTDNPSNPVMFVIFHDCQAYPTYHIIFK